MEKGDTEREREKKVSKLKMIDLVSWLLWASAQNKQ